MVQEFNGANLRIARRSNDFALADVANHVDVSRQFIHRLEVGRDSPNPDLAEKLASTLHVYPEFFFDKSLSVLPEEIFHFRRLATTKVAVRESVRAKGDLFHKFVLAIDSRVLLPPVSFPAIDAGTTNDIERATETCRSEWGLGLGPIDNMIRVAENAGAVVTTFRGVSSQVDALSIPARRPVIVINDEKGSACRIRFDIGHEIGHLVLHEGRVTGDRVSESEANRFASAFLVPRSSFVKEFPKIIGPRLPWKELIRMKLRWKVSKAALIYRAHQLELLDDGTFKRWLLALYKEGEKTGEREDKQIQHEQPELIGNSVRYVEKALGQDVIAIGKSIGLREKLLEQFLPINFFSSVNQLVPPENSVKIFNLQDYRRPV